MTMERHNVHPAPWTMALLLNWETALEVYTDQLRARKPEECMKLSRWLVEACAALQDAFIKAGTPAPSGPAEVYRQLLQSGYEPPGKWKMGRFPISAAETGKRPDFPEQQEPRMCGGSTP